MPSPAGFLRSRIAEIQRDDALRWYGVAMAFLHVVTYLFWVDQRIVTFVNAQAEPICWPLVPRCEQLRVLSATGAALLLRAYFAAAIGAGLLFASSRLVPWAYAGLVLVNVLKLAIMLLDYRLRMNQHYMGFFATFAYLLVPGKRDTLRVLVTLLEGLLPWLSPATLEAMHVGIRKLGHVVEYGILAVLWHRALAPSPRAAPLAFVLAAAYGGLDELWQGLHPNRVPAVSDVGLDAGGALLGLLAWTGPWRESLLRGAAWGVGALAGVATLGVGVDLALGRSTAGLGVAAVGLGLVAGGLGCLARRTRIRVSSGARAPPPP